MRLFRRGASSFLTTYRSSEVIWTHLAASSRLSLSNSRNSLAALFVVTDSIRVSVFLSFAFSLTALFVVTDSIRLSVFLSFAFSLWRSVIVTDSIRVSVFLSFAFSLWRSVMYSTYTWLDSVWALRKLFFSVWFSVLDFVWALRKLFFSVWFSVLVLAISSYCSRYKSFCSVIPVGTSPALWNAAAIYSSLLFLCRSETLLWSSTIYFAYASVDLELLSNDASFLAELDESAFISRILSSLVSSLDSCWLCCLGLKLRTSTSLYSSLTWFLSRVLVFSSETTVVAYDLTATIWALKLSFKVSFSAVLLATSSTSSRMLSSCFLSSVSTSLLC